MSDTKRQTLFDFTYMSNLKKSNSEDQRVEQWLQEAGGGECVEGMGRDCFKEVREEPEYINTKVFATKTRWSEHQNITVN